MRGKGEKSINFSVERGEKMNPLTSLLGDVPRGNVLISRGGGGGKMIPRGEIPLMLEMGGRRGQGHRFNPGKKEKGGRGGRREAFYLGGPGSYSLGGGEGEKKEKGKKTLRKMPPPALKGKFPPEGEGRPLPL